MLTRPILQQANNFEARLGISLISVAGLLTSPIKHRLFWRCCNGFSKILPLDNSACVVEVWPNSKFRMFVGDPYWSRLIAKSFSYEHDFEAVLYKLRALDFTFLDCGANFGYWSIFVSSKLMGEHTVLAIEASPETFQALKQNCELNNNRFTCLQWALSSESGQQVVMLANNGHAGAHIETASNQVQEGNTVTTITLDDLVSRHFPDYPEKLLVKLDVEGQEINALKGAKNLLETCDSLFYYEDHGQDTASAVTQYILEELGLFVFFYTDAGEMIQIKSAHDASRVKKRKSFGYNFWACKPDSQFLPHLSGQ